jgi:hypothetical protein
LQAGEQLCGPSTVVKLPVLEQGALVSYAGQARQIVR